MRRRIIVSGPLDVAAAWGRYEEPTRWPEWAPQIRAVDADGDRITPGLEGIVRGPLGVAIRFRIERVDAAARTWSWTVTAAGMRVAMHHDLTEHRTGTAKGTRAGLTIDGPAMVALTYGPAARVALRRLLRLDP